jgi:hypothetical protein
MVLLSLLFTYSSCGIRKKLSDPEAAGIRSAESLWKSVVDQNIEYDWYHAKANLDFVSEEFSIGGQADIRMKKDSLILISVRKFGFEMARVLIRKDSVFMLNRLQANYAVESIDSIKSFFNVPFSYSQMEEILVGNQIIETQQVISGSTTQAGYSLSTRGDLISGNFQIGSDNKVQFASYTDLEGRSFDIEFEDYKDFGSHIMASDRSYFYPGKANAIYSLVVRLEKIEIDQPKKIRFEIPSSYTEY